MAAVRNIDPAVARARSRKAVAVQNGRPAEAATADRDLREAKLAAHIRALVDQAPPLTAEQRLKLAGLLLGGVDRAAA